MFKEVLFFPHLKSLVFFKSMIVLNFPIWWSSNILNLFNISTILNNCIFQWFSIDVTTRSRFFQSSWVEVTYRPRKLRIKILFKTEFISILHELFYLSSFRKSYFMLCRVPTSIFIMLMASSEWKSLGNTDIDWRWIIFAKTH